jgi:hypothetical protein
VTYPQADGRVPELSTGCDSRGSSAVRPCERLAEIRGNLTARIAEAGREGWLGEVEGLKVSLAGAEDKLAQIDRRSRTAPVDLGLPAAPQPA